MTDSRETMQSNRVTAPPVTASRVNGPRVAASTASVPATLAAAREAVEPALRAAVDRLPSSAVRHVAAYHFGWEDAAGRPVDGVTGKYLRPALTLLATEAGGGRIEPAVPGAVAVELVHNFSLLHDDLMDRDEERHHRATAWKAFGPAKAILAGDALLALAEQVVLGTEDTDDTDDALAAAVLRCLNDATQELIRGQIEDVSFEQRIDVGVDEVLAMVDGKTAALISCATAIGGMVAGASESAVRALADFGTAIGVAFQLVDDLLGIWGRPEVTGKPVLADLRVRKKSVPIVYALRAGGPSSERLQALLVDGEWRDEEDIALAAKLVEDAGGRDWTADEARRHLDIAAASLERGDLLAGPCQRLLEIAAFVTDRER
jgi:geranylgeranyl diphosphate synthase type I